MHDSAAEILPSTLVSPADIAGAEHYLHEAYADGGRRSRLLDAFYRVKPLLPRQAQLALRRVYARKQVRRAFPRWPIEPALVDLFHDELARRLAEHGIDRMPLVDFWPHGARFAATLTHDVEGPAGVGNVLRVAELEARHGVVSSWNFVAEWYDIPDGLFDTLRAQGHEIGLHGIKHDGLLFSSRERFEGDLPAIGRYLEAWGAVGFRSPATGRNAAWIHELPCLYDTSFPDSDPFEPQSGGCCSPWPYRFGDVVELPITLVQDHTLFEILRLPGIDAWTDKCRWLIEQRGLVNLITHPDYLLTDERLARYGAFLEWLTAQPGGWIAPAREVAAWWRTREGLRCVPNGAGVRIDGAGADVASVLWARASGDGVELTN